MKTLAIMVTVRVTDSAGATDSKAFTLTVNNTNDAPEFTFTAPISTDEDASFMFLSANSK